VIGQNLGNYRIVGQIGQGGFATVYEAVHRTLGHRVAVKALHRQFENHEDFAARFVDEARILAHLDHPHIVRCIDFYDTDEVSALIVEMVDGQTLESIFAERPDYWSLELGLTLFLQILDAMHYAHTRPDPVVHRDIKPGNVFIKRRDDAEVYEAKVMDFGIAKIISSKRRQTRSGVIIGTPWYMAPEQILSASIDARTDIYALGVLLYQMVTGQLPFHAVSDFVLLQLHVEAVPRPPRAHNPSIAPALEAIILRAMAKSPDDRFESAGAFREALARTLELDGAPATTPHYTLPRQTDSPSDTSAPRDANASTRQADAAELRPAVEASADDHPIAPSTRVASAASLAPHLAEAAGAPAPAPELDATPAAHASTTPPPAPGRRGLVMVGAGIALTVAVVAVIAIATPREPAIPPATAPTPLASDGLAAESPIAAIPDGFVLIQPGTFEMGSPVSEPGRRNDEDLHPVTLTRLFLIATTELTRKEWTATVGRDPSTFEGCAGDCPVDSITWFDAASYANARSRAEHLEACYTLDGCSGSIGTDLSCKAVTFAGLDCNGYRLPTEAEWEYAARAGTTGAFFNGPILHPQKDPVDPQLDEIGWYGGNARGRVNAVAQKKPNPWGLYDVSGNLWEWVHDRFGPYPHEPITDPLGADEDASHLRSVRGGSSYASAKACRLADRGRFASGYRNYGVGVRLARTWTSTAMPP